MKFMITYDWGPDAEVRATGIERFQRTGGLPPAGVELLGRWTRVDDSGGFVLVETDDATGLAQFALMWSDLMEITCVPVIDDAELAAVLSRQGG